MITFIALSQSRLMETHKVNKSGVLGIAMGNKSQICSLIIQNCAIKMNSKREKIEKNEQKRNMKWSSGARALNKTTAIAFGY